MDTMNGNRNGYQWHKVSYHLVISYLSIFGMAPWTTHILFRGNPAPTGNLLVTASLKSCQRKCRSEKKGPGVQSRVV